MMSVNNRLLIIVAAACFAVVPRLFFLNVPFQRDEGCYAYVSDTIDRGGIPYRDAFDHKPPGIFYLYNLSFKLFGRSIAAPRIMALIFAAAAGVLSLLLVERMGGNFWGGLITMVFLGLSSASPAYKGFDANTEIFTLPFLVGGCLMLLGTRRFQRCFLAAGFLIGIAFVIKQVAVAVAAPVFLCAAFPLRKKPGLLAAVSLLFAIGVTAPFGLFALFFAAKGAFHDFWASFYIYNRSYVAAVPWSLAWEYFQQNVPGIMKMDPVLWLAAAAGIALYFVSEQLSFRRWLLAAMLAGSFVAAAMGRYFYGHYFIVMLPFLAASIGLGASKLYHRVRLSWVLMLGCLLFLAGLAFQARFFTLPNSLLLERMYGSNPFYQSVGVGNFLRARAKPDARVFIIGSEGQILFYSGLQASSRIFYFYPLVYPTSLRESFRSEVLETIKAHPPDILLWVNAASSHFIPLYRDDPYIRTLLSSFPDTPAIGFSPFGSMEVLTDPSTVMNGFKANSPGSITIYERTTKSPTTTTP